MGRVSDGTRWVRQYEKLRVLSREILGCDVSIQLNPTNEPKKIKKPAPTYCQEHKMAWKKEGFEACPFCERTA